MLSELHGAQGSTSTAASGVEADGAGGRGKGWAAEQVSGSGETWGPAVTQQSLTSGDP